MSADAYAWLPFLLQTADALFPTGAYAHSLGFEEIVRLGAVRDEATLIEFLLTQIAPAQRELELPYLRFAFEAAMLGDVAELCVIDAEISAWKLARESREASVQLGGRRLKALRVILPGAPAPSCESADHQAAAMAAGGAAVSPEGQASAEPCDSSSTLRTFTGVVSRSEARGHHLVVCGVQAAVERVPLEAALAASFYQSLAAICAAAPKLIRLGQDGCQRALRVGCGLAAETVERSLKVERSGAGWLNPMLEIASMRHERAAERLFIS